MKPRPDPAVMQSYGLMPYNRQGVFITNSEEYWDNLFDFLALNAINLLDEQIDQFYDENVPNINNSPEPNIAELKSVIRQMRDNLKITNSTISQHPQKFDIT